jgi:hypothetical protein
MMQMWLTVEEEEQKEEVHEVGDDRPVRMPRPTVQLLISLNTLKYN